MIEVGKDLWRSSGPTTLLKQGCLELAAQGHVHIVFECLQGWRRHNLTWQPVPGLGCPPDVQREPPVLQCVRIASGPGTGHH